MINIILIFSFSLIIQRLFQKNAPKVVALLALVRSIVELNNFFHLNYWIYNIFLALIFLLIRIFILYLGYDALTKEVSIEKLKPGMILAERIKMFKSEKGFEFIKSEDFKINIISSDSDKKFSEKLFYEEFNYNPQEGLTLKTIKKLRKWKREGLIKYKSLRVFESIEFSIFIFMSYLGTIIFKGDFISFFVEFIINII